MKIAGVAVLVATNLLFCFCYRFGVRSGEQEQWRELALHCVDVAAEADNTLRRCMAQLDARRRCVCFEEPLKSRVESTGAQP